MYQFRHEIYNTADGKKWLQIYFPNEEWLLEFDSVAEFEAFVDAMDNILGDFMVASDELV